MTHPVLDLPMEENDADAKTVRDYLKKLLVEIVTEQESFSGKRPFGNSGWIYDLYKPLVKARRVKGELCEMGYIMDIDGVNAEKLILKAIADL